MYEIWPHPPHEELGLHVKQGAADTSLDNGRVGRAWGEAITVLRED